MARNWIKTNWGNILSIVAVLFAIVAVFRCEAFVFTESWLIWSVGISTTVLSVAITAAVAIQVYNSIVSESKITQIINEKITENKTYLDTKNHETRQEFLSLLHIIQSQRFLIDKDYETTLGALMKALNYAKECKEKIAYNTANQALKELIRIIKNNDLDFSIKEESKIWYQSIVSSIMDKSIVDVEEFINHVKARPAQIPDEVIDILERFKKKDNVSINHPT